MPSEVSNVVDYLTLVIATCINYLSSISLFYLIHSIYTFYVEAFRTAVFYSYYKSCLYSCFQQFSGSVTKATLKM